MDILKKFFSFSIGSLGIGIVGLLSIPILTRLIDPHEYGIATLFLSTALIFGIVSLLGMEQAFIRFFYITDKKTLFLKTISVSLLSMLIVLVFIKYFSNDISINIGLNGDYFYYYFLYLVSYIFFKYSILMLRMQQKGLTYSLITFGQRFLDFIVILTVIFFFRPSHHAIIIGSIVSFAIMSIISLILSRKFWFEKESELEKRKKISYKELFLYSLPLMISGLIAILYQTVDKLFLRYYTSSEDLGIYSAAFQMAAVLNIVQSAFSVFWTPLSLERYEKNPLQKKIFTNVSVSITIIMISFSVLLILFKDIFVLFLDERYREASLIIPALILMPVLFTMSETIVVGIHFKYKSSYHIVIALTTLLVNVVLSVLLIPIFGSQGAALSVGISYLVFYYLRLFFGMRLYFFDSKLIGTSLVIFSLFIYILLAMFINSLWINIICSLILFLMQYLVFKSFIDLFLTTGNKYLKNRRKK